MPRSKTEDYAVTWDTRAILERLFTRFPAPPDSRSKRGVDYDLFRAAFAKHNLVPPTQDLLATWRHRGGVPVLWVPALLLVMAIPHQTLDFIHNANASTPAPADEGEGEGEEEEGLTPDPFAAAPATAAHPDPFA